jgi:hypothetical protein
VTVTTADAALGTLRRTVDAATRRLEALEVFNSRAALEVAQRVVSTTSTHLDAVAAEQICQQTDLASELLAARDRFGSHVLAASVLEASEAAPHSVMDVLRRGVESLSSDLARW